MEQSKEAMAIDAYSIGQTSMEQVFLKVAAVADEDNIGDDEDEINIHVDINNNANMPPSQALQCFSCSNLMNLQPGSAWAAGMVVVCPACQLHNQAPDPSAQPNKA